MSLQALRSTQFARLDRNGQVYLDYTGSALYTQSQIDVHYRRLRSGLFGNPHSESPASTVSSMAMERARARLLRFLRADPDTYCVCFTANASAALRLVGEAYPFTAGSRLVLTADNHNSVNGIRSFATRAGASVRYVPLEPELRSSDPESHLAGAAPGVPHLFAFPAQSNFSGVRHPLQWIEAAHGHGYHVLLDAAALTGTARLRLDLIQPDYVCLSFYKMFGFPTGIGALVARRQALARLERPWFAGGTVDFVSTQMPVHGLRTNVEGFEDGTPNFLAFNAVCDGLDLLDEIGLDAIGRHCTEMTARLLQALRSLRHGNGRPMIVLYGPASTRDRGGTVAFNVVDPEGSVVPFGDVVAAATRALVSVRGGCFCNPGAAEMAFAFPPEKTPECLARLRSDFSTARFADCIARPVGAVRASVGAPTNTADIVRLIDVLCSFRDQLCPDGSQLPVPA